MTLSLTESCADAERTLTTLAAAIAAQLAITVPEHDAASEAADIVSEDDLSVLQDRAGSLRRQRNLLETAQHDCAKALSLLDDVADMLRLHAKVGA